MLVADNAPFDVLALALVSIDAFEPTAALLDVLPVIATEPVEPAAALLDVLPVIATEPVEPTPVPLDPGTLEPELDVELAPVQPLVVGLTEICGAPEASTLTFTLNAPLFPASVTMTVALEGVVDVLLACTPALALSLTLSVVRVWVAASVAMFKVASDAPLRSIDDVNDPLALATVVTVGSAARVASVLWLAPAFKLALTFAQLEAEGLIKTCAVSEPAPVRLELIPVPAKAVPVMPRAKAMPPIKMAVRGNDIINSFDN